MILAFISGPILIVVVAIGGAMFAATRLPQWARSVGRVRADYLGGVEQAGKDKAPPG